MDKIISRLSYSVFKLPNLQELLMRMTLDSICKVGFGVEIGTLDPNLPDNQFAKAFDMANTIVTLRFIDPLWKVKRFLNMGSEAVLHQCIKTIDGFTYNVIKRRKAETEEAGGTNKVLKVTKFQQLFHFHFNHFLTPPPPLFIIR